MLLSSVGGEVMLNYFSIIIIFVLSKQYQYVAAEHKKVGLPGLPDAI